MPRSIKTEAVVLRSIRYGEADRILHLYTPDHGRVGAIAKGVRKTKSRFGGRLEPFHRVGLVLHQGRSDLLTVTAVDTVTPHRQLHASAGAVDAASRACDAVSRLFEHADPQRAVFHLLCNELQLLDDLARNDVAQRLVLHANQIAFRLKLLLAAGFTPMLSSCATCGEGDRIAGFSGAAGGVVCASCEAGSFPLGEEAHAFMTTALGAPLASSPQASERALRQAERAVSETVEHHAHTRLRMATATA
ncbi:MAG TPA: DNA repair protein RecO [Baekduia sp.]|nr:DNA repair protein RecO [Baekduia sp.]